MQGFLSEADIFFNKAAEEGKNPVMISLELKGIRPYSARFGIEKGDRFLSDYNSLIEKYFDKNLCFRYGDYSFLACSLGEGVDETVPSFLDDVKILAGGERLSVKAGIYNRYHKGDDINTVCEKARMVCQKKNLPGDASGIFYFDDKMEEELHLREFVLSNIDRALRDGSIKIYYQPKIRLMNLKVCGYEALSRWIDPEMGVILPEKYIPILEENNLTWKIDTFLLHEIARDIQNAAKENDSKVYVSFNLTYSDFLIMDVPATIESIARDHDIDPSSLFVEITERTILKDSDLMRKEIEKLFSLGFRVIIDDFGNGSSSIGLINDYRFFAIKMGLDLMKTFNSRNRKIIESIVVMAKNLGIHTVSEGVETEEQVSFLKNIGCEIVQGYYFGEPGSIKDISVKSKNINNDPEGPDERELFEKAGLVNVITDQAMNILFFNGDRFDIYYVSDEMRRILSHSGYSVEEVVLKVANSAENSLGKLFRRHARNMMRSGRKTVLGFSANGRYFKIEASVIAENKKGIMFRMFLHESSSRGNTGEKLKGDNLFREMLPAFNNIFFADLSENTAEVIKSELGFEITGNTYNYDAVVDSYIKKGIVFPSDKERFRQTFDSRSLSEKLRSMSRNGIIEIFRMKVSDVYKWVFFRFFALHGSEGKKVIICVTLIENDSQPELIDLSRRILGFRGEVADKSASPVDSISSMDSFLWKSLMEMSDVRYFWKDSERRFLGASRSFLEFYDLELKDILGRNDEEMGWHPDDTQYRSDEFDVLEKGAVIRNSPGQIYAKGAKVNILATKYPLYRNGEIVGLMGYFLDKDTVFTDEEELDHALFVDISSGLLNSRGLFLTLQGLDDNYRSFGIDYSVSVFEIAEYSRVLFEHDRVRADAFSEEVGRIISESFGREAVIAKTQCCGFTVCMKDITEEDLDRLNKKCIQDLKDKCSVDGKRLDVTVSCGSTLGSEGASVHEVLTFALSRLNVSKKYNGIDDSSQEDFSSAVPDLSRDFPLPFLVLRPVITENSVTDARFVFINDMFLEYTGLIRSDLLGRGYREFFNDDSRWLELSGRAANGETINGRNYIAALGQWMEFVGTPSSIPGCCDIVFWPAEDTRNERELLTKGHAADNAIIHVAGYLNISNGFGDAINKSLSELGRVLNPDRIYILDSDGAPLYEWSAEGVLPRMENTLSAPVITHERIHFFQVGHNYVVEDVEMIKKVNPEAYAFLTKMGTTHYILIPLFDSDGEVMGFVGVDNYDEQELIITIRIVEELSYFVTSRMITDRLLKKLNNMSNRDELTGLLNRHGFRNEMDEYLYDHPDDPFTLVLIDVDDFKIVNDMYGHATGDEVLKNLANDLNDLFEDKAIIARSGGDELSLAIRNSTAAQSEPLIRELSEMDHTFTFEEKVYNFRLSIGYAEYPAQADDISLLLRMADSALYAVKAEGKHGLKQYTSEIKITKRLQLAFNLKNVARNLPGAILVYKAGDDKRILYANDELINMFECDNIEDFMEYTGGTFDGIVHPDDIEAVEDAIWEQINNNSYMGKDYVDYKIRTKSGAVREVIDVGRFVENEFYGKVFYVIILDKDEWKHSKGKNE